MPVLKINPISKLNCFGMTPKGVDSVLFDNNVIMSPTLTDNLDANSDPIPIFLASTLPLIIEFFKK
ncbi:MAG: hypothetical protein VW911_01690 [Pelagibacteraceae bacterium]